jgi:hypothetical protein
MTAYQGLSANTENLLSPVSALREAVLLRAGVRHWLVARFGGAGCSLFVSTTTRASAYRIAATSGPIAPDDMLPGATQPGPGGAVSLFVQARR